MSLLNTNPQFDLMYKTGFEIELVDKENILKVLSISPSCVSVKFMNHIYPLSIAEHVLSEICDSLRKTTSRVKHMMSYVEECRKFDFINTYALDAFIENSGIPEHIISIKDKYEDVIDCRAIWHDSSDRDWNILINYEPKNS